MTKRSFRCKIRVNMSNIENNVCCRNITIVTRYVQQIVGSDSLLLDNLPYSAEYLKDEHNWIPLKVYVEIMNRAIELLKDQDAPYKMGLSAQALESWGAFKYLQKVFASVIFGPVEIYKQVGRYNEFFNKTKDLLVVKEEKSSCYFKVKFKNNVDPVDDYVSDAFIRGILCGVPRIWNLPEAELKEPLFEYDIKSLLIKKGGVRGDEIKIENNMLYVREDIIGREVILVSEFVDGEPMFLGQYREIQEGDKLDTFTVGILISKDYKVNDKVQLVKDRIYNAPYFIYHVAWQPLKFSQKIYRLTFQSFTSKKAYRDGIESQLSTIRGYVETLEDKVIERTEQLNDAKKEAEYWKRETDKLLYSIVPQHIAEEMVKGKLVAQEIQGTVVFTDLKGFTEFSRNLEPQQVSDVLTKYFTNMSEIIAKYGGWVNKFMGDGILVIFGLHSKGNHTEKAIQAAIEMQLAMSRYTFKKRIGVASGPFITGEFGSKDLRKFDVLGHVVNLASRLQSHADTDDILVCEKTFQESKQKFKFSDAKKVSPKGVGEIDVYTVLYDKENQEASSITDQS